MFQDHLPLIQLGTVIIEFGFLLNEWPDVITVSAGVIGNKGNGIAPFAG
jgi:hypothetical protein